MSVVLDHEPRRASINFAKSAGWVTGVAAIAVAFLAPYIWMVASSFKSQFDVFSALNPLNWRAFVPVDGSWANYAQLFENGKVATGLINSFLVACIQVSGALVLCTTTAYALSRIAFPGRRIVFGIILATFMLPTEAIVVPVYRVISGLGLQDTLIGIALPWLASAFGLLLVLPAFEEIPRELDEAARIDGAGHFRIFWNVILPNVKTALATLTLIIFLFSWNSFLWPLVVTSSPEKIVVQVAVAQSVSPGELPNWGLTFAGATAATIPLIVLFLFLQKYFVQGLATSGMK
jgi:ABC-type glycerol-3-phosphate transport system permease component